MWTLYTTVCMHDYKSNGLFFLFQTSLGVTGQTVTLICPAISLQQSGEEGGVKTLLDFMLASWGPPRTP